MKKIFLLYGLIFLMFHSPSFALEKPTHEKLNEALAPVINPALVNIGFDHGVEEYVNSKKIKIWIKDGGSAEDEPFYTRSFNHFHNPLLSWDKAGYGGTFKSAILWAQEQGTFGSLFGGNYSWKAVRDYYYLGLTSATKTDREKNLADTFQGIGQLMHLVEDMSVPAHTRNDAHVLGYHYEKAVEKIRNHPNPEIKKIFQNAISNPVYLGSTIQNISNLFDKDVYNGTNPSANTIGLSEYTQANFFSEGTIFKNYPHPSYTDTNYLSIDWQHPENTDAEDGKLDSRIYIRKTVGEQVQRLASISYISYNIIRKGYYEFSPIVLDDKVYEGYAQKLLPRAVGYSAGLLNYFFRGQINIEKDPNNSSQYVIKNESDEYMTGTFSLYYDDTSDNRRFITSWGRGINAKSQSEPVIFTEPTNAKEKGKYILVFQGTLGSETGAVVGRVVTLATSKELILYRVGNKYKTYNTDTKVAKDYTGVIPGDGRIIWNEDYSYALQSPGFVKVTDMKTGKTYGAPYYGYSTGLASGEWVNNNKATVLGLYYDYGSRDYKWYYMTFENNSFSFKTYSQPSGINAGSKISAAEDGSKTTYNASGESSSSHSIVGGHDAYYVTTPHYLVTFDTATKLFTSESVGSNSQEWIDGGDSDPIGTMTYNHYTYNNNPYALAYNKNTLKVLYMNETNNSDRIVVGRDCGGGAVPKTTYSKISSYDKLGTFESSGSNTINWIDSCHYSETNKYSYTSITSPNYYIMKDGNEIITFAETEKVSIGVSGNHTDHNSDYWDWTYTYNTKSKLKLYFNGTIYSFDVGESTTVNAWMQNSYGGGYATFNAARDKAVIVLSGWLSKGSGSIQLKKIFYISNGAVQDITANHPDFPTADWFAFVKE